MGRNVNSVKDGVFERLKQHVAEEDKQRITDTTRHICVDEDNKSLVVDFVKKCRIKTRVFRQMTMIGFEYAEQKYLMLQGPFTSTVPEYSSGKSIPQIAKEFDLDSEVDDAILQGACMLAICNGCLAVRSELKSLDIIERCLGLVDDDDPYNTSFPFSTIAELFEAYTLIMVDDNRFLLQFEEDIDRLYAMFALEKSTRLPVAAKNKLLETLQLLSSRSIAASIINFIESDHPEYSFLQLYQCLEYLYSITKSLEIAESFHIPSETSIGIVADHVKSREMDCLLHLLSIDDMEDIIQPLYDDLVTPISNETKDMAAVVAKHIYKARCNIAHLRYNQEDSLQSVEIKKLIDIVSNVIYFVYAKLENDIVHICSKNNVWKTFEWKMNT